MALRKEQVLAIAALLVGGLVGRKYLGEVDVRGTFTPKFKKHEEKAIAPTVLVTTPPPPAVRIDFATEPSETRPLPPRPLAFPDRAPLTLMAIPLDPGPDYRNGYAMRVDGRQLDGVTLQAAGSAEAAGGETPEATPAPAPAAPPEAPAAPQGGRAEAEARAAQTYDRIYLANMPNSALFGTIEPDNHDLYKLEEGRDFDGVTLRMRMFEVSKQKVAEVRTFGNDVKIERIVLAGTLRNEIARRERKIPRLASSLAERRDLIHWLLDKARENSSVYAKAEEHALLYRELASADPEGLRLHQKVLRARGDIAGELKMLEGLPEAGPEAAFRFEGLGTLKAQLGLWVEAEADLRKAVQLMRADPRPHAALAEFLRQRGRTREALDAAQRVEATMSYVADADEKARVAAIVVKCRLAAGDVAGAKQALAVAAPREAPQPYLEGCVHYAAADVPAALEAFRNAGGTAEGGRAQLGQAACLAWQGKAQEAHDLLVALYDREPLLRHRTASALAWLFLRTGQFESATGWIDRALEADPQDPFAFYLRGRTLRLSGQFDAAIEALKDAMKLRDDFVHAIAEMAAVQSARALEGRGNDQAESLVAARRYIDRAVDLAPAPSQELFELQALHSFDVGDVAAARRAFAAGRDLAPDEKQKYYAKGALAVVDYSRGLDEDALLALGRITTDLGREEPMAKWADKTARQIEDHAQKEALGDSFERAGLGQVWVTDADPNLTPDVVGNQLVFRGTLSPRGKGSASAERVGAVPSGRNFLAFGATMKAGPGQSRTDGFFGLAIEVASGGGNALALQVKYGLREGKPYLRIEDGREDGKENVDARALDVTGFDPAAAQQLELRVVPRGDEAQKMFALQASWNGEVVYRRDLKQLTGHTRNLLKTILFVEGTKGQNFDVAFDDYRLERRKGN